MMSVTSHFEPYQARLFLLADTLTVVNRMAEPQTVLPGVFRLGQNYLNPFNPLTTIVYELPVANDVDLSIYNLLGQKVATMVEGKQTAGEHKIIFNASHLASGIYIYRLQYNKQSLSKKMILLH